MGNKIEYPEEQSPQPQLVTNKKMWNVRTQQFDSVTLHTFRYSLYKISTRRHEIKEWLLDNFGKAGNYESNNYWAITPNQLTMSESVLMFCILKWGKM